MTIPNKSYLHFFVASVLLWWISQVFFAEWSNLEMVIWLVWLWMIYLFETHRNRWKTWVLVYTSLGIFALLIEYVWTTSCLPYGCFSYTQDLWVMLWSIPILLILIRPIICLSAYSLTQFFQNKQTKIFLFIAILLVYDLALDPVNVANELWQYDAWWIRFGVPFSNFLGWIFSWLVSYRLLSFLDHKNATILKMWAVCMMGVFWGMFVVASIIIKNT